MRPSETAGVVAGGRGDRDSMVEALLCEITGAEAATTALVGDSPFDVATAQNGGLGFIGVTTGTHSAEELRAARAENRSLFAMVFIFRFFLWCFLFGIFSRFT